MKTVFVPNLRHALLAVFFAVATGFSPNSLATPACTDNESPTSDCSYLYLPGSNLTITVPNSVTVNGIPNAIQNDGNNNSITNNGLLTLTGFAPPGTPIVSLTGTGLSFNNTGTISYLGGGDSGLYLNSFSELLSLSNSGTIGGYDDSVVFVADTRISTLTNSGHIGTLDSGATAYTHNGINNSGTISSLSNTSSGYIMGITYGIFNVASGTITDLVNSGVISGTYKAIQNESTINNLTNSGSIASSTDNAIHNAGTISTINNTGNINSTSRSGINNETNITKITNSGTITGGTYGIANNSATIQMITNTGTVTGGNTGIFNWQGDSLTPAGTIVTLNNGQGSLNPLTYHGQLPTNYNIIVNSQTNYGKLDATYSPATGSTTFGVYDGSILTKGTYTSVLAGITAGTNLNNTSGMYNGTGWRLVETGVGTGIWDLIADYSASNTLAGLQSNANGLAAVYNQQAAAYQAALSYDCQVYDAAGLCVSVGGRYTYAGPSPSSNQQAGLVIVGYKPVQTFRVGAFADQSVNISTPSGFSQSKSNPMWGLFAKWHMNKDETGLGVQASAVTSSSSLTATRPQLFNTEAGSGTTQFNGQGYQFTTNYHQPVTDSTALVPYLGLRYTRINAGAYTENTTTTVTSPLSYNAMAQNTFSAIGGIGVRSHLAEKLTGAASVGLQQNLKYSMGNYAGTSSIMGLESFSIQMPGNVNSMATATAGLFYDINKRERVGVNVLWQQQPFIATNTTTALATYTIGF